MSEEQQEPTHSEAKVIAWAKFRDPHGTLWSVTLREGATGTMAVNLLKKCEALSEYLLLKAHWEGATYNNASPELPAESEQEFDEDHPPYKICPIHQEPMKRREKDGQIWYSHKVGEDWCNGKAKT